MAAAEITPMDVRVISNITSCIKADINGEKGYPYILNSRKYSNLHYFNQTKQKLLTFPQMLKFDKTNTFTYIIFEIKDSKTGVKRHIFRARPVYSFLETFAKHDAIFNVTAFEEFGTPTPDEDDLIILFAGEIKRKTSNYIEYNFSSGTFMRDRLKRMDEAYKINISFTFDDILAVDFLFKGKSLYNPNVTDTILNTSNITEDVKQIWSKIGGDIKFVLLPNIVECELMTNIEKLRMQYLKNVNRTITIQSMMDKSFKVKRIKNLSELNTDSHFKDYDFIDITNNQVKNNPKPLTVENAYMNQISNQDIYNYLQQAERIMSDIKQGKYIDYTKKTLKGGRKTHKKKRTNKRKSRKNKKKIKTKRRKRHS